MDIEILTGIDLDPVLVGEIPERVGQQRDSRHRRPLNHDRNERHALAQRRLDLDAYQIGLIAEPGLPGPRPEPSRADDRENDVALVEYYIDEFAKIGAGRNTVDVTKYGIATIMIGEAIEDPPGNDARIFPAIGNCYPRH
jgi:hypothetical protein